ncbi:hypothetical protein [Catenovulum agarivorans]|uniref:hypothetical protein n=1 Tax=Catenovulum agarivorans TaxID=1172192 RepID=UPI0003668573|nr:hypothetical protein [Catenovulum agarivorans]
MGDVYGSDSIEVGELALFAMTNIYPGSDNDAIDFIEGFLSDRIEDAANELEDTDPRAAGDFWLRAIQIYFRHGYRKKEILKAYKLLNKHKDEENIKAMESLNDSEL